jgi:hypothetical protein
MISDVRTLAGEIGPRGTGTLSEKAAANHVAGRLVQLGLLPERQEFRAVSSQNAFPLSICLLALASVLLYPLGPAAIRWVAAVLALSAAPMLWQTMRNSTNPLHFLLPKVASRNVVARIEQRGRLSERVVLLAHLDTTRCRLAWQSGAARSLEPLTYLTLAILAALGLLYLAGALMPGIGAGSLWLASLFPAAYVLGMVVVLLKDDRTEFSCGAHDNAASVAVALEIGRRLASARLESTQVWLAFTGAEETDHAGLYALLERHANVLRRAAFIVLEGLGSGELVYLTRQGLCSHYRPHPDLLAAASKTAARLPELSARPAEMIGEDETGTLRRKGYRAICIAGRDALSGTLPHWHQPDDTIDTVSTAFMEHAADFVMGILRELDSIARSAADGRSAEPS